MNIKDEEMAKDFARMGADPDCDVEYAFAAQAEVVLSDKDYELFTKIMTEEHEPTELALRGAAEFMSGTMEGPRYHWKP